MFPRTYFAGYYFPPRYFPQSQGQQPNLLHVLVGTTTSLDPARTVRHTEERKVTHSGVRTTRHIP